MARLRHYSVGGRCDITGHAVTPAPADIRILAAAWPCRQRRPASTHADDTAIYDSFVDSSCRPTPLGAATVQLGGLATLQTLGFTLFTLLLPYLSSSPILSHFPPLFIFPIYPRRGKYSLNVAMGYGERCNCRLRRRAGRAAAAVILGTPPPPNHSCRRAAAAAADNNAA